MLQDVLDFYLQVCSIACNTKDLSVIAATLANGGKCPTTNKRVISVENVRSCLSLLYSCGMYDYSGQWAFTVGLPAKSGISGALMVVIPNVMGLALYSPLVDKRGNSRRGVEFCKRLAHDFNFSIFDQLVGGVSSKVDPTIKQQSPPPLNNAWERTRNGKWIYALMQWKRANCGTKWMSIVVVRISVHLDNKHFMQTKGK